MTVSLPHNTDNRSAGVLSANNLRRKNTMRITDLKIDLGSIGSKLWLVNVAPAYQYADGKRTETVKGYRYEVALPERNLDKISVTIDGKQLLETPDGYAEVTFTGLEVFIYWSQGDYKVGAKAIGVTLVNHKT